MRYTAFYASPMGKIGLSADEHGALTGLWFVGQKYAPLPEQNDMGGTPPPVLQKAARWLDAYFAGENPPIDFPLAPQGSAFQREVWALLQAIPYGKTVTYGQLAKQLQARRGGAIVAAQAVGGAVGRNKIALIIPCHRVVGAHGALTGYAGGIVRKAQLLQMEQAGEAGV